ncbi:MAG: CvpA family protein [Firmicutes bacterium]|nr:CvpA family protein [Bacillota bacterium]
MNISIYSIVLDAIVYLSALMFLISGWHKGVVRSFINFLGAIIALSLSSFLALHTSDYIYKSFIKDILVKKIKEAVIVSSSDINRFPDYLKFVLNLKGIGEDSLLKIVNDVSSDIILYKIVSPLVNNVLRIILCSFMFWLIMIIVRKISKSTSSMFAIPILKGVNSFLGAIFGLLKGILMIWLFILFLKIFLIYWQKPLKIFSAQSINSTSVFVKFYNFNPVTYFFSKDFDLYSFVPTNLKIFRKFI